MSKAFYCFFQEHFHSIPKFLATLVVLRFEKGNLIIRTSDVVWLYVVNQHQYHFPCVRLIT